MRRAHIIRPNTKSYRQTEFLFFDTETWIRRMSDEEEVHTFRLGVACYVRLNERRDITREKWLTFKDPEDLANFVVKCSHGNTTLHVVALNAQYDLEVTGLLSLMSARGWEIKSIYAQQTTLIIRLKGEKGKITIEDGMNRLRGSIAQWGKLLGKPKGTVDFDNVDDQALTEYCKRDVEILRDATLHYLKFVSDNNLGSDAYTVAGQSFAAYTHRFMAKRIYVHTDKRALELERQAYKGGMVRALQVGYRSDGPFYKLDVNSMYPYVMRENRYPTKLLSVVDNPSLEYLAKVLKVCCVIADCTVHPKSDYFPTRLKTTNIYPAYEYRDVFTTPELQRLLEEGSIIQIHHMAIYSDRSIFRDYVEYFYNKRKEAKAKGNLPYVQICKMFLNGLYGKFGSRNCSYRRAPEFDYLNPHTEVIRLNPGEPLRHVLFLEGKCYLEERGEESYNAFPAIAAHVTAYARMYLAKLIDRARRENVLYCDTDSLIVTRDGYDRLQAYINPDDLGMLKEEGKVDTVTIFGRKDYLFGGEVKRKGVSLKLGTVAVENNIKETWPGMLTFMKGKTKGLVKITRKPLHLCRKVYDGKLTDTGKVLPFNLPPAYFATYYDLPLYLLHPADRIAA